MIRPGLPILLGLTLVGTGCALELSSAPDLDGPPIQTDQTSYVLETSGAGWHTSIGIAYRNPTRETILLGNCNGSFGFFLEKEMGEEWVTAWIPILTLCASPAIEIEPGETFISTLHIFGGFPENNAHPKFAVSKLEGTYRVQILAHTQKGPLSLEQQVSNTFELRLE